MMRDPSMQRERSIAGAEPSRSLELSRRHVLQMIAAAGASVLHPRLLLRAAAAEPPVAAYGFLSAPELAILDAATALILPCDDRPEVPENERPGAREIGVVDYVQSLLSFVPGADANCDRYVDAADLNAVEQKAFRQFLGCPDGGDVNGDGLVDEADIRAAQAAAFRARPMFAGGPFSGRNPQPHFPIGNTPCIVCHGANSTSRSAGGGVGGSTVEVYPPNAFRQFLPMNRLQALSWKVRLLGAAAVPEVANNPLAAGLPEVDLRRRYRDGLAALDAAALDLGSSFVSLAPEKQREVLAKADRSFVDLLYRHIVQGTFCVPEYGGNRSRLGWQLTRFDGDSQPLGYEIYDETAPGSYRERPDKPNSTANPDEDCTGFSEEMKRFLDLISTFTGGGPFENPYCFEVDR